MGRCFAFTVKLHLVQLPQQIVGEFQIRLVDLVDQKDHLLLALEGLTQLAELDVAGDVIHPFDSELSVVQTLDRIVHIQSVLCLRRGLDIPDDQLLAETVGHGLRQLRLARSGLALDEQRLLQRHGNIHAREELLACHIILGSLKFLCHKSSIHFR